MTISSTFYLLTYLLTLTAHRSLSLSGNGAHQSVNIYTDNICVSKSSPTRMGQVWSGLLVSLIFRVGSGWVKKFLTFIPTMLHYHTALCVVLSVTLSRTLPHYNKTRFNCQFPCATSWISRQCQTSLRQEVTDGHLKIICTSSSQITRTSAVTPSFTGGMPPPLLQCN